MSFMQDEEEKILNSRKGGQQGENFAVPTFASSGSAGNNNERLARIMSAYDLAMDILGWDKPLSAIVSQYQASVDGTYHKDWIKIATLHNAINMLRKSRASTAFQPTDPQRDPNA